MSSRFCSRTFTDNAVVHHHTPLQMVNRMFRKVKHEREVAGIRAGDIFPQQHVRIWSP